MCPGLGSAMATLTSRRSKFQCPQRIQQLRSLTMPHFAQYSKMNLLRPSCSSTRLSSLYVQLVRRTSSNTVLSSTSQRTFARTTATLLASRVITGPQLYSAAANRNRNKEALPKDQIKQRAKSAAERQTGNGSLHNVDMPRTSTD